MAMGPVMGATGVQLAGSGPAESPEAPEVEVETKAGPQACSTLAISKPAIKELVFENRPENTIACARLLPINTYRT